MTKRVVALAEQMLEKVPQAEMRELLRVLTYYNSNFAEGDRGRALRNGSTNPSDAALERVIAEERATKTASSQDVYMSSTTTVCRFCGK